MTHNRHNQEDDDDENTNNYTTTAKGGGGGGFFSPRSVGLENFPRSVALLQGILLWGSQVSNSYAILNFRT